MSWEGFVENGNQGSDPSLHPSSASSYVGDSSKDAITEESESIDGVNRSYGNSTTADYGEINEDRSCLANSGESTRFNSSSVSIDDVSPIERARARLLQIVTDYFLHEHVVEVGQTSKSQPVDHIKVNGRKSTEARYEGDPGFTLPLMYIANLYETLVNEVNARLISLDGIREKAIGVALEAAGGLYRRLAKKFPRSGHCSFKRKELATSLQTRSKFPEMLRGEKRVRFVVVYGLEIVERPAGIPVEDANWFKRLTGRQEAVVSESDYKFFTPRHKNRRYSSESSSVLETPISFHPLQQSHHQNRNPGPNFPQILEIPIPSQHLACFQSLSGAHVAGRFQLLPTGPAKFCDECGAPYLRETSKFCSECGAKRLGI